MPRGGRIASRSETRASASERLVARTRPSPFTQTYGRAYDRRVTDPERWLTFKEAAVALDETYGLKTTGNSLEKLSDAGRAMPSKINFGKRQVLLSQILPWLKAHGHIEGD